MRNLTHYSESATDFLLNLIKSKRNSQEDPDYKIRIAKLENALKLHFSTYDNHFSKDTLASLTSAMYLDTEKKDLWKLYSYHNAIMQKLKAGVTAIEINRVLNTCQNCTINDINSFDHIVPQIEFPEYTVHPKNLFPSCTTCNGHKSKIWRNNNKSVFLNLYIDKLPDQQYLFAKVQVNNKDIQCDFEVDNPSAINSSLFSKISYHYDKLMLCERFLLSLDRVITPFKNTIISNLSVLSMQEAKQVALQTAALNRKAFGFNYWKSILEIELLNNQDFLALCEDEVKASQAAAP
jgi:hypothetical protein